MKRVACLTVLLLAFGNVASLASDTLRPASICTLAQSDKEDVSHGGDLNSCGCDIDHRTGVCHCHRAPRCGC